MSLVFERTGGKKINRFFVTGPAIGILDLLILVSDSFRHMSLMTLFAVAGYHLGGMRLVALGASRDFAVRIMTAAAEELAMLAWSLFELFDLFLMTGQARCGHIFPVGNDLGSMRIAVTLITVRQFEMGAAGVALAADGNNFANSRGVAVMAVLTTDLGFVCQTLGVDVRRRLAVAFDAVVIAKFGRRGWRCACSNGREQEEPRNE